MLKRRDAEKRGDGKGQLLCKKGKRRERGLLGTQTTLSVQDGKKKPECKHDKGGREKLWRKRGEEGVT